MQHQSTSTATPTTQLIGVQSLVPRTLASLQTSHPPAWSAANSGLIKSVRPGPGCELAVSTHWTRGRSCRLPRCGCSARSARSTPPGGSPEAGAG